LEAGLGRVLLNWDQY